MKLFFKLLILPMAFWLFWPMTAQAAQFDPVPSIFAHASKKVKADQPATLPVCMAEYIKINLFSTRQWIKAGGKAPMVGFVTRMNTGLLVDYRGYKDDPHIA